MGRAELGGLIADRYRLRAVLRRGGMGAVWLAADELLHRQVAVKEIPWVPGSGAEGRESRREQAFRDARAVAELDHPNIAGVYDVVQDDGRLWMVMQLAPFRFPYRSLSDVVQDDGPLPPAWAAQVGLQMLAAIHAAHGVGVLHRDINPGNVLLGPAGRVMLAGFGMVTADGSQALTTPEGFTGALAYMAPECARGEPATPAADLWSLGATLYTAVEGRPPFHRDGKAAVFTAVIGDYIDTPSRAGPLWPLLSALLCKDPGARPDTVDAERLLWRVAGSRSGSPSAPFAAEASHPAASAGPAPGSGLVHHPSGASSSPAAGSTSQRQPAEARSAGSEPDFIPGFGPRDESPAGQTPAPGRRSQEQPLPDRTRQRWQLVAATAVTALIAAIIAAIDLAPRDATGHRIAVPAPHAASPGYPAAMPGHQQLSPAPQASHGRPVPPRRPAAPGPTGPRPLPPGRSGLGVLPRGFSWYHDPTGFSIGMPESWQISHRGHLVYIQDPNSGRFLIIDQTTHPKPSPLADWRQQEAARVSTFPGYRRIRLQTVRYAQAERAADWEFTYDDNGQLTQVLNRNILANAHHAYALYWSTPASEWKTSYRYFRAFAATFRPAAATFRPAAATFRPAAGSGRAV
jgi:eukaryotic-like serine/threonine-protein kinase